MIYLQEKRAHARSWFFRSCTTCIIVQLSDPPYCLYQCSSSSRSFTSGRRTGRPSQITWAFVADSGDDTSRISALENYLGLQAAMKLINDNDLLSGTSVNFTAVQGATSADPTGDVSRIVATIGAIDPFGFVLPSWLVNDVVGTIAGGRLPIVSPSTVRSDTYASAFRNWIFLRQPFAKEHLGMLNYALNGQSRCSYSAVFGPVFPGIDELVNDTVAALRDLGQPEPIFFQMTDADHATNLTAVLRERFFSTSPRIPGCAFMIGLKSHIEAYMDALWGDPRLDQANTYFFAPSAAASLFYNSSLYGTAPYANLRFIYPDGNPSNATIPSVALFQQALDTLLAVGPNLPSWITTNIPPQYVAQIVTAGGYTPASYNAFLAGMFIAEVVRGMPSITSSDFLDRLYDRSFVKVNETVFGPFSDRCLTSSLTQFPCFCNTGGRSYYVAQINTTTGKLQSGTADPILQDNDLLSITTSLSACTLTTSDIQSPMNIVFVVDDALTQQSDARSTAMLAYVMTLVTASQYANTDGGVAAFGRFNPLLQQVNLRTVDLDLFLANLTVRSNPYVLIGGQVGSRSSGIPSLFRNALVMDIHDDELTTATQYSHYELHLTPVLADYIHTMASLLFDATADTNGLGFSTSTAVYVLYGGASTAVAQEISTFVTKSLHTYQASNIHSSDVSVMSVAELSALVSAVVDYAAREIATVLFIASINETTVASIVSHLAAQATSKLPTASQRRALTTVAATSELAMFAAKTALVDAALSIPSGAHLFFPSVVADWWDTNSVWYPFLSALHGKGADTPVDHPGNLLGVLSALFLYTATRAISTENERASAQELIEAIFTTRTISSFGVSYGPLYSSNCSKDVIDSKTVQRSCQCYKGPRVFYASTLNDWLAGTGGSGGSFQYTMTTCGVLYAPLMTTSSLSSAAIAGIAVGGAAAVVGFGTLLLFCSRRGKRDNRAAPKDPTKPFAMMFTDIQSSTSLWARAPEQMGSSVDQHHRLIRQLVETFHGYEVKTIGDSFMVAFHDAADAVNLAVALQDTFYSATWPVEIDQTYRALAQESVEDLVQDGKPPPNTLQSCWQDDEAYRNNWNGVRVRVGLHWGYGSIKLDPVSQGYDYYGTVVNTAARVEGIGNGGQVLITKDFYSELERVEFNFGTVDVTPLGPQPLRGLDAPVPLYQLNPVILRSRTFNPLRLDVENTLEDESASTAAGTMESASQAGDATTSAEGIVNRLLMNKRVPAGFRENVMFCTQFLEVAMSTSTAKWRKETTSHLMRKWHVHTRKQHSSETDGHYHLLGQLSLVVKLMLALEDVRKAASATIASNDGVSLIRRMSYQQSFPDTPMTTLRTPPSKIKRPDAVSFQRRSPQVDTPLGAVSTTLGLEAPESAFDVTQRPENEV